MRRLATPTMFLFLALVLLCPTGVPAQDSALAVINAGVEATEDAPLLTADYRFLPGEYVYLTFQVSGFRAKEDEKADSRQIALTYEATMQDDSGDVLSAPVTGEVKVQLSPEDKNWVPRRSASFLIPSLVAAGKYHVHVEVKDLFANATASTDVSFRVGGEQVEPSQRVSVQNFRFLRQADSREPLSVAAYRPGDTVFTTFDIVGFGLTQNKYHVVYGVTVLGPDGKHFLDQPRAAELEDSRSYPAQFLPERIDVLTKPSSQRGEYLIVLAINDLISKQTLEFKQAFRLE